MNYYPHHIGDYAKDTGHLSWDEDMAYTRLLRAYYSREGAIPVDQAYRLTRASSVAQRKAVDSVLQEFFSKGEDGWHNKRADFEISKAREDGEENRARKDNEKERQKRHRERRKELFAQLRELGVIPSYETSTETLQELLRNAPVTRDVTRTATAIHKPITNNQKPITSKESIPNPSDSVSGEAPDDHHGNGKDAKRNSVLPYLQDAEKVLDYLNATAGRNFEFRAPSGDLTPNAVTILQRLKDGYSAEQLREVVLLKAEKWRSDEKMAEYLRPQTLFGKQKFSQYVGELSHG